MREFSGRLLEAICFVFLMLALPAAGQAQSSPTQVHPAAMAAGQLDKEWAHIKKNYPAFATEYLRREALLLELAALIEADRPYRVHPGPVGLLVACDLFRRLGVKPPGECAFDPPPRLGRFADCFEPRPDSDGGYTEPSVAEAEACIEAAKSPD